MSTQCVDEVRVVDGKFDLNWLAGRPLFYFDLAPALAQCDAGFVRNPERLQLLCERCIGRVAPNDLVLFQSTGFFLVVQSSGQDDGQATANAVNVALLKLLFGTDCLTPDQSATLYRTATPIELSNSGLAVDRPSPEQPESQPAAKGVSEHAHSEEFAHDSFARFVASGVAGCADLAVEFAPVCDLRRGTTSTFFCTPVRADKDGPVIGAKALKGVDPRDRPWLDEAMLEHALEFAREIAKSDHVAAIGTSVSYETLAWSRGRRLYQNALRALDATTSPFLIVKIDDVPAGTPAMRIAEIVSTIRPFAKRIILQLPHTDVKPMETGIMGIAGFIAALPSDATFGAASHLAKSLVRTASAQKAFSCLAGVNSHRSLALARAAGIHFACGRAIGRTIAADTASQDAIETLMRSCGAGTSTNASGSSARMHA